MRVDHRGPNVCVARVVLQCPEIVTCFDHMSSEAVAERVSRYTLGDIAPQGGGGNDCAD